MSYNDVEKQITLTDYHLDLDKLDITDENRWNFVKKILNNLGPQKDNLFGPQKDNSFLPAIDLEYNKMFVPGGSKYVSDKLNINVDQCYHVLWDSNLLLSTSCNEYFRFNKVWRYSDFFID
jgi:hypothetical protein